MTYIVSDNGVDREMTADEIAAYQAAQKPIDDAVMERKAAKAAKEATRAAALAKLGLTADEIAALFG